jgi:hypothetical protein
MNAPLPQRNSLHDTLLRVLVDLALRQPDPADRAAMIAILKKDGWLK